MTRMAGDILDSLLSLDPRDASTEAHDTPGTLETLRCACGGNVQVRVPPPPAAGGLAEVIVEACPACNAPLMYDPNIGRLLAQQWRLERRLGGGGMGSVYLATEVRLGREVAVKVLHPRLAAVPEHRERFEREARVMAKLEHPNLATLFAVEVDKQVPFLVMKVVRGRTLARLVTKRPGGWSLADTLPVITQVGAALSELHRCGFVHRDLKPGNIMVTATGHVTLLDYGLTRTIASTLTQPGVVLGSPQFMSPEQVMARPLDARSDQYSLALLCSLLLTGRLPYATRSTMTMLVQHVEHEPEAAHVSNPAVPRAVSDVLLKAMRKRAQDRYESIERFIAELEKAAGVPPSVAAEAQRDELPTPTPAPMPKPGPPVPDVAMGATAPLLPQAPSSPQLTGTALALALASTVIREESANATVVEVEAEEAAPVPSTRPLSAPHPTPSHGLSVIVEKSLMVGFMPTVSDAPRVPERAPLPRRPSRQVRAQPAARPVPEVRWDFIVLGALGATIVFFGAVLMF
jgi:serine/threonine protein kinase